MTAARGVLALEIARGHPCFDEAAHGRVGRVHLPVARRCNIQCGFCERRICANLTTQHPGWARSLLMPQQALELVRRLVEQRGEERFVVGVAGPGEPLANSETFEALRLVHEEFPRLTKCVSSNGLLLEERLSDLVGVGVTALTVTVNAVDGEVGGRIYAWARHGGIVYRGREAAEVLIAAQARGIRAAIEAGLALKVNTVLIPGVNDRHVLELAHRLREMGISLMNLMPLIPGGRMQDLRAPSCEELRRARLSCGQVIKQFGACEQCRADVVRFPRQSQDERLGLGR